jgi:predicted nucleotide-binding protein
VIIGHPRWTFRNGKSEVLVPTEYSQYEGAILKTLNIPLMVLAQDTLFGRGVFEYNFGQFICRFPEGADRKWLKSSDFQQTLRIWLADMADRRDLFMGYCSSSSPTAEKIKTYIERELRASVLDWRADFSVGRTVLEEIAEAGKRCSAGIFLFTRDDVLSDRPVTRQRSASRRQAVPASSAIPRDNVVFEAGYFIATKGKRRVLIVREEGAKMPADLGGDIYAALEDRHNIDPIKSTLKKFVLGL